MWAARDHALQTCLGLVHTGLVLIWNAHYVSSCGKGLQLFKDGSNLGAQSCFALVTRVPFSSVDLVITEHMLVVVASLIPQDVNAQLQGHLVGALNNGATAAVVKAVRGAGHQGLRGWWNEETGRTDSGWG